LVDAIDAITTYDEKNKKVAIFLVNRSLNETIETSVLLSGFKNLKIEDQVTLASTDWTATNNVTNPTKVTPSTDINVSVTGNLLKIKLAPVSWQVINVSIDEE
jgi:alpha-N-arabinofuranosidase